MDDQAASPKGDQEGQVHGEDAGSVHHGPDHGKQKGDRLQRDTSCQIVLSIIRQLEKDVNV
jgi:hypothetical protein